ncbi:MAG TPA: nitroreductase family protein [Selenomonadales bacterium]|nr:nitroreductase family protein [Selenomonadales bacterium]
MMANETLKIIKQRRSIRSFTEEQIKEEELQAVLEAGLYAPSAGNQQAWHFTVIQSKELLDRLNFAAKEAAKQLDNEHVRKMANNEKFNIFYGAPTLVLVSGLEQAMLIEADCAAATQNLLLAAESIGLGACWINFVLFAFHSPDGSAFRKELEIPEGYKPYSSAALGYKKAAAGRAPDRKPNAVTYIR